MDRRHSADAERLELAMQRRALHAHKFRSPRDIAGEAADLGDQVVALEHFPRLAERQTHDVLAIAAGRHRRHHRTHVLRQHIGGYYYFPTPPPPKHEPPPTLAKPPGASTPPPHPPHPPPPPSPPPALPPRP